MRFSHQKSDNSTSEYLIFTFYKKYQLNTTYLYVVEGKSITIFKNIHGTISSQAQNTSEMADLGSGLKVAVVGAGVVGLTSATMLQEALPEASITIIADKFGRETTSDGAAGIFRPGLQLRGDTEEQTRRWLTESFNHYKKIIESKDAAEIGVKPLSGYHFSNMYPKIIWNALLKPILDEYRLCTEEELKTHGYKYGTFSTTLLTECRIYQPYLTRKFTERGGRLVQRHLESLEELAGHYDIVCNCPGFGAKDLCSDMTVTPIRGQVFKVKAPWVKYFYYVDYDMYIIPGFEAITLGGTRNFDSYNAKVDKHDSQAIWERCLEAVPSLKDAEIQREWVGWRPYRPSIRVQKETMSFPSGRTLKVVHNYGHGGYGVMCSPGTSMEAVRLVQEMLQGYQSKL